MAPPEKSTGVPDDVLWWTELWRDETLAIQGCDDCDRLRHPPQPACPWCGSWDWSPRTTSGRGVVHSFTVHHHPPIPGFTVPFAVGLIDLVEGVRVVAKLVSRDVHDLRIGAPVQLKFVGGVPCYRVLTSGDPSPELKR